MWVDAGNFAALGIPSAAERNRGMVEGMNRIGYAAAMLGERELADGIEAFQALRKTARFPFVSANFIYEDDRSTLVDPYVIHAATYKGGTIKIGVLGLNRYNSGFLKATAKGRNVVVSSPFDTARKLIPEVRAKADLVVVLTSLSISQSRQLAQEVDGIDVIVGASGGVLSQPREASGGTAIVYPGNQGQNMSEIRVHGLADGGGAPGIQVHHHYLNRDYPNEPALHAMVLDVLARENDINRELASATVERPALPAGVAGYVGGETCAACHQEALASWEGSGHARAFQTLVDANQDFSPECVGCHVVGFGRRGGFVNAKATPELKDVQCEACHGPGSLHVDAPARGYGAAGARSCLGCHDTEHSPEFDFFTYWPRIKH